MGVPLDQYRKAQEYRQRLERSDHRSDPRIRTTQSSPKNMSAYNTSHLRVKSRSPSAQRRPVDPPTESSGVYGLSSKNSDLKSSKIQRYKQIERELSIEREIKRDRDAAMRRETDLKEDEERRW